MTSTLQKVVGAAVSALVLGGTFVAAAAIGDARHDGASVTPSAEVASTPVAAAGDPVPFGEEPDTDAAATWPATSASQPLDEPAEARARQAGPVPTDDPGVIQPISSAAPESDTTSTAPTTAGDATSSTTAARGEVEPAGEDATLRSLGLLGGLVDLPWFRFLDPCADAEDDSCGEGTGGTILPLGGGTEAGPLQLGSSLYEFIAITALGEQCNVGTRADGSVGVILFSNNPVDLDVTWWPAADPTDVHEAGPFETTDAQRREWDIDRAEGRTATPDAGGALTCLEFPRSMTHGLRHQVHVEGTDLFGSTDSATYSLTPPAPRTTSGGTSGGRPPVRFSPIDERGGKVVAALDDAQEEQLWVAELVRNGPDASTQDCTSIENEVLGRTRGSSIRLFNEDVVPLIIPETGETYPYERRFDTAVSVEYWPGEGVAATICAWITRPAVRSFDRPRVLQRTTLDVTAPRWYRTRITATEARLDRAVGEDPVTARVEEGGFNSFGRAEVLAAGTAAGTITFEEPIVIADSDSTMHPYQATVAVASSFGEVRTLVETPNKLCPVTPPAGAMCPTSFRDTVTVRMPGPRARSGLCGSSFGECEPPTSETFLGELTLVVESYAGPSGPPAYGEGFGGWDVTTGRFTAADDPEPTLYARLDWNRSSAVASATTSGQRPSVTLVMVADRPVTATASSVGWDLTGDCGLPPQSSTTLSVSHVFRWDAACFGTSYFMEAVLTDAEGRETRFGPGGEQHLAGIVDTGGFELVSIDFDVRVTPKRPMDFAELDAYIGGGEVPMTAGSTGRCRADDRTRAGVIRNAGGRPIIVGDPVYVGLSAGFDSGEDCRDWDRIDLSGSVPLDQLLAGPVELRFEDDAVTVVVTASAVGRFPLAPRG